MVNTKNIILKKNTIPPYTICIRTLGKGGKNYVKLLDSIMRLQPQPQEVIISIPHGYNLPQEQLGYEQFIRCNKGMVLQRVAGGESARSEYILFLDDDLEFPFDLVQRLYKPLVSGLSEISFPILFDTMLPRPGLRTMVPALIGSAVPMFLNRNEYYIKILANGGWSYNRFGRKHKTYYQSHSAPGPCFFATKNAFLGIHFEEEEWVQIPSYAQFEDQTMFYKFYCCGITPVGVSDTGIVHLDSGKAEEGRRVNAIYARQKNLIIFWHRFLYSTSETAWKKIYRTLCFSYSLIAGLMVNIVATCVRLSSTEILVPVRGIHDAYTFLKSQEYRNIPQIKSFGKQK